MEILPATMEYAEEILSIYAAARAYMKEHGNPLQWGDTYPPRELVLRDIQAKNLYMCVENGEIYGVFVYFEGEEPTYRFIDGAWKNDAPYGVMHRVAVAHHGCGVARACFDNCFERCRNLKIDTHRDNLPMQKALEKNGFVKCGIIYLENGEERLAYQKSGEFY